MTKAYDHHREWCAVETDLPYCDSGDGAYGCTLKKGHPGEHQACAGHQILSGWLDKDKEKSSDSGKKL